LAVAAVTAHGNEPLAARPSHAHHNETQKLTTESDITYRNKGYPHPRCRDPRHDDMDNNERGAHYG
jgi:hypothetical protein